MTDGGRRAALAFAAYAGLALGTLALLATVRALGADLVAPAAPAAASAASAAAGAGGTTTGAPADALLHVLAALAAIVVVGHVFGRACERIGQPPVIGEVVAGIALGPSLLGAEISGWLLPPSVAPYLGVIAQLGVVLYMFLVGLELDLGALGRQRHAIVLVSHAGIAVPFSLGCVLALGLYPRLATQDVPFNSFALFLGVAMSITAFPVLARILTDLGIADTPLGRLALSCAAVDDVTAWSLLAIVVGVTTAEPGAGVSVLFGAAVFIVGLFAVVRPVLGRWLRSAGDEPPQRGAIVLALAAVLAAAWTTEAIGIHAIFGAFLLGAVVPSESALARHLPRQLGTVVTGLLLPAFFAFTGMRTRIGLLLDPRLWAICAAIIAVAVAGKLGGTTIAARFARLSWRDAATLGVLMNTRGLMELIVLNVGLELGIITPTLFAIMVVMALATTMMTGPALRRLLRPGGV